MTSVLNHAALEAAVSARYLEHYLHTVEELPNDIQMHVSQLRELDGRCTELISNIEEHRAAVQEADAHKRKKAMLSIKRLLLHLQEVGDEKLALMSVINEHIEGYARQLDVDKDDMDPSIPKENEKEPEVKKELRVEAEKVEKPTKRQRRQKTQDGNDEDSKSTVSGAQEDKEKVPQQKKKKKRKAKRERDNSPLPLPYDPNEPKYCLCNEVSYGEMIGCDNDKCPIEWFHFNCVELTTKPKGRWYCPKCRGDKPNVKRPDK